MRNYTILGLTGPTGAGKGEVGRLLAQHGYEVIDSDILARKALEKGSPALLGLKAVFGNDIIKTSGEADRALIAKRAFSTPENTELLNSIVHPQVFALVFNEIDRIIKNGGTHIVYDAPVLFESKSRYICDSVITVLADYKLRCERIMKRDSITVEQAKMRMKAQHNNDFYVKQSDYIIYNNGDIADIARQLEQIIRRYTVAD